MHHVDRRLPALIALVALAGLASAATPESTPIEVGDRFTIASEVMGEDRVVLVSLPPDYERGRDRYHVVYLTDGPAHLVHTRGTVDFLARNGLMPQLIIVGIANTNRTRDLTPTAPTHHVGNDGRTRPVPDAGGADRFLRFIETELMPWVDARYRTEPFRLLAGHSFGGTFALHAFCARPDLFGATVAVSPSLQWDDDLPLRELEAFLAGGPESPRTVFVAMADEEAGAPPPTRFTRLQGILRRLAPGELRWDTLHLPAEDHGTVVLPAHFKAFQMVYEGWVMQRDATTGMIAGGLAAVQQHYDGLSRRFGHDIEPPEMALNLAGYHALRSGDTGEAIRIFEHTARVHADSPNVHDSLGEALEASGRLEDARDAYQRAVERGRAAGDPNLHLFRRNLERVEGAIADGRAGRRG